MFCLSFHPTESLQRVCVARHIFCLAYLKRSLADQIGNANFLMLYGDYGTGKSHALLWAQHLILHDESADTVRLTDSILRNRFLRTVRLVVGSTGTKRRLGVV